jgi:hypothetical protein
VRQELAQYDEWKPDTAYGLGGLVRVAQPNTKKWFVFRCDQAGRSGAKFPWSKEHDSHAAGSPYRGFPSFEDGTCKWALVKVIEG